MILNILLLILILMRLVIGTRLFTLARRNNLPNMYWLAVHFFAFIFLLFAPTVGNPLGNLSFSLFLFTGVNTILTQIALIYFNHTTFYQNRKNPVNWFMFLFAITSLIMLYGVFTSKSNYDQSPWVAAYIPTQILLWGWHAWIAYQAWNKTRNDEHIEDWVKSRYQLIIAYSIALSIGAIASFIRITFAGGSALTALGTLMGFVTLIFQIISVSLQFLVWVMPEGFRTWLNRNQKAHSEERIHKQAANILNIVGTAITQESGLDRMMCLFAIRKSIGKSIGADDTNHIEEHAVKMGYPEWISLVESKDFGDAISLAGNNINMKDIVTKAKKVLTEKQSLFTMQAR